MRNIVLIGFMGCGKSAVGRRLASKLKLKHIDTDSEIEKVTNRTVEQIFAKDGPFRFRSEEKILLKKLAGKQNLVISTGGGIVLDEENVELLQKDGVLIHLFASPEVIHKRVKGRRNRPLLNRGNLKQRINELLEERTGAYDVADLAIDTGDYNVEEVVKEIINFLKEGKYLS
ncbi:MAG: shikimate kinase [Firmicutes bacterium]|nr:shikimate kinase [Bacillota bacterium]